MGRKPPKLNVPLSSYLRCLSEAYDGDPLPSTVPLLRLVLTALVIRIKQKEPRTASILSLTIQSIALLEKYRKDYTGKELQSRLIKLIAILATDKRPPSGHSAASIRIQCDVLSTFLIVDGFEMATTEAQRVQWLQGRAGFMEHMLNLEPCRCGYRSFTPESWKVHEWETQGDVLRGLLSDFHGIGLHSIDRYMKKGAKEADYKSFRKNFIFDRIG